jgi:hypothetical protein
MKIGSISAFREEVNIEKIPVEFNNLVSRRGIF